MAQNGKELQEIEENVVPQGWKAKFITHLQQGKPRFILMITSPFKRHSTIDNGEGGEHKSRKTNKNPPTAVSVKDSRRKQEDNMAVIFMGFILVFLVCHLPRLLLNIHELFTIKNAIACMEAGKNGFPIWSGVAIR